MSDRRIFIQCLASYNAGSIVGHWVDLDGMDAESLMQETYGILAKCVEPNVTGFEMECTKGCTSKETTSLPMYKGDEWTCDRCGSHATVTKVYPSGEEWMIADSEGLGDHVGEYTSFDTIAELVETLDSLDDDLAAPFLVWWDNIGGDMPDKSDFEDAYIGEYDRFQDYADESADELIACSGDIPQTIRNYFDYESYARDLQMDYTVVDAPNGNVWIFHA